MTHHDGRSADRLEELLQLSGPRPEPPVDRFERARAAAHAAWQAELQARRRRTAIRTALFGLAAAAVLVLVVARARRVDAPPAPGAVVATVEAISGPTRLDGSLLAPGDEIRGNAAVRTERGGRATLRLANGVELRLDAGTEVRFPAAAAVALDRGGIFVDTGAAGAARRVEIRTSAGIARDVGTAFEVRMVADAMRVRVRGGLVNLESGGAIHQAGRAVELMADRSGVARRVVPLTGPDWSWVALAAAAFDVDGKTLAAFLDWAAREGGWSVTLADEALRKSASTIVLRGSIDGLTPAQALETILPTCGLTHRIEGDRLVVSRAGER
jgi:ferric-dicitrate binding protein FerR (iron transport regulator)